MDFCRLCAKSDKKPLIPIIENNQLKIREKLEKILNVKVNETGKLPKSICLDCLSQLNSFDQFQQSVAESQIILGIIFNENIADVAQQQPGIEEVVKEQSGDIFIIEEIEDVRAVEDNEILEFSPTASKITTETLNSLSRRKKKFDRFDCYMCQKQFPGNHKFVDHFTKSHTKSEIKYTCYLCDTQVKTYRSYIRHLAAHQEDKKFKCDLCDKNFSQKVILAQHLNTHSIEKSFKCEDCGALFKQNASLFKHRKQKHTEGCNKSCKECDKSFANNETLQQHMRSKHKQEKTISCQDCGKTFASQAALRYHNAAHHESSDLNVSCKHCGKKYKTLIVLQRHVRKFHSSSASS